MDQTELDFFEQNQKNGYVRINKIDGTIIDIYQLDSFYTEKVIQPGNTAFSRNSRYDISTLKLKSSNQFFYNIAYGMYKTYDISGNIANQVDQDAGFTFTIYNLIDKFKNNYNLDLSNDVDGRFLERYFDDNDKPVYEITLKIKDGTFRIIIISGESGNVVQDRVSYSIE